MRLKQVSGEPKDDMQQYLATSAQIVCTHDSVEPDALPRADATWARLTFLAVRATLL